MNGDLRTTQSEKTEWILDHFELARYGPKLMGAAIKGAQLYSDSVTADQIRRLLPRQIRLAVAELTRRTLALYPEEEE